MPRQLSAEHLREMKQPILEPRWLIHISPPICARLCTRGNVTLGDFTYSEVPADISFSVMDARILIRSEQLKSKFRGKQDRTGSRLRIGSMFGNVVEPHWWWSGYYISGEVSDQGIDVQGNIFERGRRVGVLCNATWARHLIPNGAKIITRAGYAILTNGAR